MDTALIVIMWIILLLTYLFAGKMLHDKEKLLKLLDVCDENKNDMLYISHEQHRMLHVDAVIQDVLMLKLMALHKNKKQHKFFHDKLLAYGIDEETLSSNDKTTSLMHDLISGDVVIEENNDGRIKKVLRRT